MKAWLITLCIVAGLVAAFCYFSRDKEELAALNARRAATRTLASYLAKTYPGKRVLVISNPFTKLGASSEVAAMEAAGIKGLQEGFGSKTTLKVVTPELKPEARANPHALLKDPESPTPLSYLVTEDAFDKLINANAGTELVVSLIGLPADLDKAEFWNRPDGPRLALLLPDVRIIGEAADVRRSIQSGKIAACVLLRQKETVPQSELRADFNQQFVLVTPENVVRMDEENRRLLTR